MAVTVVLADGFAGEVVEIAVGGTTHRIGPARTSPLTGLAGELALDDDPGGTRGERLEVAARLQQPAPTASTGPGRPADARRRSATGPRPPHRAHAPWTTFAVGDGETLVLDLADGRLTGRVRPGPVGFA